MQVTSRNWQRHRNGFFPWTLQKDCSPASNSNQNSNFQRTNWWCLSMDFVVICFCSDRQLIQASSADLWCLFSEQLSLLYHSVLGTSAALVSSGNLAGSPSLTYGLKTGNTLCWGNQTYTSFTSHLWMVLSFTFLCPVSWKPSFYNLYIFVFRREDKSGPC